LFHNHPGEDYDHFDCESKIVEVFENVEKKNIANLVVLDQSTFYPTAGGQQCDIGLLTIDNIEYKVINVEQVGQAVMHELDRPLPTRPS